MTTSAKMAKPAKELSLSLRKIADIDGNIAFFENLINHYKNYTAISNKLSDDLAFIKRKNADKMLTISVIGEFSSGKSTFINALLRMNLLEKNVISGTTVATTVIEYGKTMSLTLRYKDGKEEIFNRKTFGGSLFSDKNFTAEFKKRILAATTDGDLAQSLREVIIALPSALLKEGIRIVDTPGTNAVERWHEDVTKTAIRETSDVSIIITSLTNAMTASLLDFVEDNLSGVIDNCIFVATMPDLVRPVERSRTLKNAQNKVNNKFNREDLPILSYTPLYVLGGVDKEALEDAKSLRSYSKEDYSNLITESVQTEQTIFKTLSDRRVRIQVQKLLSIFDESFTSLSTLLQKLVNDFEEKRNILESSKKRNLGAFTAEMKRKYIDKFRFTEDYDYPSVNEYSIIYAIDTCTKETELKACSGKLKTSIDNIGSEYSKSTSDAHTYYMNAAKKELENFWNEFSNFYSEFKSLSIPTPRFDTTSFTAAKHTYRHSKTVNKLYREFAYLGSAAGSLALIVAVCIGTAVFPGIGTLIGFFIGSLIVGFGTKAYKNSKFEKYKSKMKDAAKSALDTMENECKAEFDKICKGYIEKFVKFISGQIDRCAEIYGKEVSRMITDNEKEQVYLSNRISEVKNDLADIEKRKANTHLITKELNAVTYS